MNSLSWLIYGIDVLGGINNLVICLLFVTSLASIGVITYWISCVASVHTRDATILEAQGYVRTSLRWWLLFAALSVILPSRHTVVMIASSEIGEKIINSEEFKNASSEAKALMSPSIELLKKYIEVEKHELDRHYDSK